jgi:hypothetical protein
MLNQGSYCKIKVIVKPEKKKKKKKKKKIDFITNTDTGLV